MRRRHKAYQPEPVALAPEGARAGLVRRYIGRLATRRMTGLLNHPAAAQVAGAVVAVVAIAVAVGLVVGVLLAAALVGEVEE